MLFIRENRNRKFKNKVAVIATFLAVFLVLNPSMLAFADAEQNNENNARTSENTKTELEDNSINGETNGTISENTSYGDEQENIQIGDNGDIQDVESNKEKESVREKLQPGSEKRAATQSVNGSETDDGDAGINDGDIDNDAKDSTDEITVTVIVRNDTYPVSKGAPWEGVLFDTKVKVPSNYTMMQALHQACQENDIDSWGTDSSYVRMIGNLKEFDGGGGAGWMGTLNDWFTNTGFDSVSLQEGDVISIEYSCSLGDDVGSSYTGKDKRIKSLTTSIGELTPEFDSDFKEYNLIVPQGTEYVSVYTTAVNRNYLVKSIVDGTEYNRGAKIPVKDGTVINVKCGDPSWPSMNSYEQADTVKPITYRINIYEGNPEFLVEVSGTKCIPELDHDNGIYMAGEKVSLTLKYNRNRYQVSNEGVKAYIGGSSKFIQLDDEGDDRYSFTMPGNDVEIKADCETRYDYPLNVKGSLTGCTMKLDRADGIYFRDDSVTFTLSPEKGKRINDLSVKAIGKESESTIKLGHVSQNQYTFNMPGEDVLIYAESEAITENGLKGYTISTDNGKIQEKLTKISRTSICTLPERATEYDLLLDIDKREELFAVRTTDLYGNVKTFAEADIKGIPVGTRNTALFGEELTVTVLTKDNNGDTHTYTIRIKTKKSTYNAENPDAIIEPVDANGINLLPYKKTLMTSGVQLYEVDYPTEVADNTAKPGYVYLDIMPTYEDSANSIEIRCKQTGFMFTNGNGGTHPDNRWYYQSTIPALKIEPGETFEVPIEIDFKLQSGDIVTRKYLYRITNGRYTKQRFQVLSSKGKPITPTAFSIDGQNVGVDELSFTDGMFTLDVAPGDHTAVSMGKTVNFTVTDNLSRPIVSDVVTIQTDVPEYNVTLTCQDRDAVYTIRETNTGIEYYYKSDENVFSLPPGKYDLKTTNESKHLYSRDAITVTSSDQNKTAKRPYLFDPEYVVNELNLLEEIQCFDAGDGLLEIFVPEYQSEGIVVQLVEVSNPDEIEIITKHMGQSFQEGYSQYFVQRDLSEHSLYLKYRVYNQNDGKELYNKAIYETDSMELYMPSYNEYSDDNTVIMPADVRTLSIGFGIENGSIIGGGWGGFNEYYDLRRFGYVIPVIETNAGITDEQMKKAGYKVKYTIRYKNKEDEEFLNVWLEWTGQYSAFYRLSNDHACEVFETNASYNGSLLQIDPDFSDFSYSTAARNGLYEVTAWFEDKNGNKSKTAVITVYKDTRPPVMTAYADKEIGIYDEAQADPVYTNEPVKIQLDAEDRGIGLHKEPYSIDGGKTWTSENTFFLTEPQSIDLQNIWVRDNFGYISTVNSVKFDSSIYRSGGSYMSESWFGGAPPKWWDGTRGKKYFYVDTEKPQAKVISSYDDRSHNLAITVKASDKVSGLDEKAYSFDGGSTWQVENSHTVTLGEYRADQILVRDKAGNQTVYDSDFVWTQESMLQAIPKITNVKIDYGPGGGLGDDGRRWYQNAKLTIETEGVDQVTGYSFDGVVFTGSDNTTIDVPQIIKAGTVLITDIAGNLAVYDKEIDISNIDNEKPKIISHNFRGNAASPVREIYTEINASDSGSKNLKYAITPIPLNEFIRGFPAHDLKLEWSDDPNDDQFTISNVGKKYDKEWLAYGSDYVQHGTIWHYNNSAASWGVRLWVKDAAGNVTYKDTWVLGGYIDQKGPDISEVTTEYKRFNDATGIVKVYVAATEPKYGAGLASKAYSFDGGKTWQASNSISIPIGASIPAGQIKVRDAFGNISTYNKVVKTTLQDVITRIKRLDPRKAKDKDFKEILDLFNQLTDREKSKVYNWQDFLNMMGNRKDQDWDDDYGDIGDPDDGDQGDDHGHDGDDDHGDNGDDHGHNNDDQGEHGDGSGDSDGDSDNGSGNNEGTPSDGNGNGGGGTPDNGESDGGKARETVSVALSDANVQNAPDTEAEASSGQSYREAEIDKIGGGLLSQGMVELWELMLLIIIVLGAYTYGAVRKYKRYKEQL